MKTTIIKNAKAVKVELKKIEDNKLLILDPLVKTDADSVLLAVKDATIKKACVKPVVTPVVAQINFKVSGSYTLILHLQINRSVILV